MKEESHCGIKPDPFTGQKVVELWIFSFERQLKLRLKHLSTNSFTWMHEEKVHKTSIIDFKSYIKANLVLLYVLHTL